MPPFKDSFARRKKKSHRVEKKVENKTPPLCFLLSYSKGTVFYGGTYRSAVFSQIPFWWKCVDGHQS